MNARYLILSGACEELRSRLAGNCAEYNLDVVFNRPGLLILASSDLPHFELGGERGLILGELFSPDPPFAAARASSLPLDRAIADGVSHTELFRFWGHYIAVVIENDIHRHTVLRAPFGSLGAYHVETADGTAITSDVGLLRTLGLVTGAIDWAGIAHHVIAPNLRSERTCLFGVAELAGGHMLSLGAGLRTSHEAWSPWRFTRRIDQLTDETEAVTLLRQYIDACVGALAGTTTHAVLGVSGGLDSSIVAAALAQNGIPLSCLTLFTSDPAGDERHFARLLSSHLGITLYETLENVAHVDLTHSAAAHLPRPVARGFAQSGDRSNLEIARRVGADTFFSGGGGDNVFCYLQSAAPVADCLLTGKYATAWATARDMSQIADCSIWAVLRSGLRRAAGGQRTYRWRPELSFLTSQATSNADAACVPLWSGAPDDILPGKATHVAWLVGILNHLEGYGRERSYRTVWPLMAQPIVELCLRIPSWMWSRGGQNRALARRAYADILPSEILNRRSKGTPDCFVVELFETNRKQISELLCGGLLASNGIVNREEIARFLAEDGPVRGLSYWRIMGLVDVEAWLRAVAP